MIRGLLFPTKQSLKKQWKGKNELCYDHNPHIMLVVQHASYICLAQLAQLL